MPVEKCIICRTDLAREVTPSGDGSNLTWHFACKRCGYYDITSEAKSSVSRLVGTDIDVGPKLSHWIRKTFNATQSDPEQRPISPVKLHSSKLIQDILSNPIQNPAEQLNNYIRWIGDTQRFLGDEVPVNVHSIVATIGSHSGKECGGILNQLVVTGLIKEISPRQGQDNADIGRRVTLSFEGWEKYNELTKNSTESQTAFMAMEFNKEELDTFYHSTLKPAVAATGFELFKMDEKPKSGLIDTRMRVEIRNSRFLISDLTHKNSGAYWEAGFAEGLGKPVIYTCRKAEWDMEVTHFDTNHHLTIIWDPENPQRAAADLKDTIRATLPHEAKMSG